MAPQAPSPISYIEIPATEIAATKTFYTEAFGWGFTDFGPSYAAFDGAGIDGGLNAEAETGPGAEPGAETVVGPFVLLTSDDLDASEAAVRDAGGEIVSPSYDYPGGRRFHFKDPSGNVLGVYQPAAD